MSSEGFINILGLKLRLTGRHWWWFLPAIPIVLAVAFIFSSLAFYGICRLTGWMVFSGVNSIWFFIVTSFFVACLGQVFKNDSGGD